MHYKHTSIYVAAYDYFIENIVINDKKYRQKMKHGRVFATTFT